jgi:adenylate cyclase
VGIGLDTGDVVAGHVGSRRRLEFTLIGVPVNNAAYLSKVRPARVLLSEATREELPPSIEVAALEAMLLKGANRPQPIYELETAVTAEG